MKNLVTRAEWRARPPKDRVQLDPRAVKHLVIHYSAFGGDEQDRHALCASRVRAIQAFHMDSRGWSDIAYSWLFCKHGYIFRGRGWPVRTAATGPANGFTVAACFLGDDSAGRDDVTDAGRAALLEVRDFVKRNAPNAGAVRCHRDFMATSCPGDELARFVRSLAL